jgi:hypothetical protein
MWDSLSKLPAKRSLTMNNTELATLAELTRQRDLQERFLRIAKRLFEDWDKKNKDPDVTWWRREFDSAKVVANGDGTFSADITYTNIEVVGALRRALGEVTLMIPS